MIRFMGTKPDGRIFFGMIISEENIIRLKRGEPIHLHAESLGKTEFIFQELIIQYEETEEIAAAKMMEIITSQTKVIIEGPPTKPM